MREEEEIILLDMLHGDEEDEGKRRRREETRVDDRELTALRIWAGIYLALIVGPMLLFALIWWLSMIL